MTPCPQCGEPLAALDDGTTLRCKWCGFVAIRPRDRRRPPVEVEDVDYWPEREGGRDDR